MTNRVLNFHSEPDIHGVSEGETFTISHLVDFDEFILTVMEPESYGKDRQVASACFSRQQMTTIMNSLTEALYPKAREA